MKNTLFPHGFGFTLVACIFAIVWSAPTQSASAQTPTPLVAVTIPFAFQTANQTLPAGTYRIDRETDHLIRLQGPGQAGALVVADGAIKSGAPDHGSLVFDRYGDTYFLRQIWTAGEKVGMEFRKSRAEELRTPTPNSTELAFDSLSKH